MVLGAIKNLGTIGKLAGAGAAVNAVGIGVDGLQFFNELIRGNISSGEGVIGTITHIPIDIFYGIVGISSSKESVVKNAAEIGRQVFLPGLSSILSIPQVLFGAKDANSEGGLLNTVEGGTQVMQSLPQAFKLLSTLA